MALTDTAIRLTKPTDKPLKKADGKGLALFIQPNGSRWWRFRYRYAGKEKMLSLGVYPDTSLADARTQRDEYRTLLAKGIDPSDHRKLMTDAQADTFERITEEWLGKQSWAESHAKRNKERLDNHIFPHLGSKPITSLTPPMVLAVLRRIEARGTHETAHRCKNLVGMICRYAIATGRAENDPTASLRRVLTVSKPKHFAAVIEPREISAVLKMLYGYGGTPEVQAALKLGPLLFCRPGELRAMKWADLDLDEREWRFTLSKTGTAHVVPLPSQAVEIIKALQPLTGCGAYVLPSARSRDGSRPLSENAVLGAYRNLGISKEQLVGHGWRATARTLLVETLKYPADIVEQQLGHLVKDPLGRAYNRTQFLDERKAMMQAWASYLDDLREGQQKIVPIRKAEIRHAHR